MITFTSSVRSNDVVVLPNPKFGDGHTNTYKRINRTNRGNDQIIAGQTGWLPSRLRRMEWDYLLEKEADSIRAFMKRNTALPVFVKDQYDITHKVVLLRPDAELSQIGRDNRTLILDMQVVQ